MLYFISKKITLALFLCVLSALLLPTLTQAEPYGTGDIASKRAEEQRVAIAKRAAKKQKEAEEKKTADAQKEKAADDQLENLLNNNCLHRYRVGKLDYSLPASYRKTY